MKNLDVALGERSYPIYIGNQLLSDRNLFARHITGNEVLIVTNETVAPLYLEALIKAIDTSKVDTLILADGERFKTLDTVTTIYDKLLQGRHSRGTTLVALGGGVVGDMTGFAAATYQRGVNFIQVPTTLLAQVDSSVGGKTGVNHPLGKNMIGAFYQPQAVIADMDALGSLPEREYRSGLAEVVKYGLIADHAFFQWLGQHAEDLRARDPEVLEEVVYRSCLCKADIVARDEREADVRAILNLGHTFGHAIEAVEQYKGMLHGESVAVGMLMAADLSFRLGWLTEADVSELSDLFNALGLPVAVPAVMTPEKFMQSMALDKKVLDGTVRLVLLKSLGQAVVTGQYSSSALADTLLAFCSR